MAQINDILSQLHSILECKIALSKGELLYFYPIEEDKAVEEQELNHYRHWDIETADGIITFYTEAKARVSETVLKLAALYIKDQFYAGNSLNESVTKLISGSCSYSDIAEINQLISRSEALDLIIISGIDTKSIENELVEIIKNSVDAKYIGNYQGNLIALIQEDNILEACSDLQKNILTELFIETLIVIGGRLEHAQQLSGLYNNCSEVLLLKQSFGINQKLFDYQSMLIYRLIASIDQNLKNSIIDRIFSSRFVEFLNNEIELTIEEMFRNNLNLTDTSARLYIHRNTLLYRIDKIYKLTGFDLRKFEDSMIFKLAWLMYKEKTK